MRGWHKPPSLGKGHRSLAKLKNAAVGCRIDTRLAGHVVRAPTNRRRSSTEFSWRAAPTKQFASDFIDVNTVLVSVRNVRTRCAFSEI